MKRNSQKMYYSKYIESQPLYERDDEGNIIYETYTDTDGEVYTYPKELGVSNAGYSMPQEFSANIALSGGDAEAREFGLDVSDYSAVMIFDKDKYDIDETCLIWHENEIKYKDSAKTEIEPNSADYQVKKKSPSINYSKFALQRKITNG